MADPCSRRAPFDRTTTRAAQRRHFGVAAAMLSRSGHSGQRHCSRARDKRASSCRDCFNDPTYCLSYEQSKGPRTQEKKETCQSQHVEEKEKRGRVPDSLQFEGIRPDNLQSIGKDAAELKFILEFTDPMI